MAQPRLPLRRLVLCIVLGAVTSWLVAAAFATLAEDFVPKSSHPTALQRLSWLSGPDFVRMRSLGAGREYRTVLTTRGSPIHPTDSSTGRVSWQRWLSASDEELCADPVNLAQEAFGWPRLCFWYPVNGLNHSLGYAARGGINLMPMTGNQRHATRAIPLLPIWQGLLLDTGFYALFWSLPLFALPLLRHRRRRRRGRCPRCNYDLKGALEQGCPECGWKRAGISDS